MTYKTKMSARFTDRLVRQSITQFIFAIVCMQAAFNVLSKNIMFVFTINYQVIFYSDRRSTCLRLSSKSKNPFRLDYPNINVSNSATEYVEKVPPPGASAK